MFTEQLIENIMENVKIRKVFLDYYHGYPGSYEEPPEPQSLEINFIATCEGIKDILTLEQCVSIKKLSNEEYFLNYCNLYLQGILKEDLYEEEGDFYETKLDNECIEITVQGNSLEIDVHFYG